MLQKIRDLEEGGHETLGVVMIMSSKMGQKLDLTMLGAQCLTFKPIFHADTPGAFTPCISVYRLS